MPYFLAVDVGGTKTDYLLAEEGRELARVRGGCIKRMRVSAVNALAHLEAAFAELAARTGVPLQQVTRTCIGTAGNTVPLVTDWLREEFAARVGGDLILVGDVEIALDAAFQGGPGVLVLAGTGSNVAGRSADGTLEGAGGYGPALADQGSGNRIGAQALRAAFLAKDEGRQTVLLTEALRHWGLATEDDLVAFANRIPAPDSSRLAEVVLRCALQGDEVAAAVLRSEGEDLGYLARLMVRRLCAREPHGSAVLPKLAFAGSILENMTPVRQALLAFVRQEFPAIEELEGVVDPIAGALWRARGG